MFVDSRGSTLIRHQIKRFFKCVITAWHVNTSSVVCTLIDNGKLADQIATLLPTTVKQYIDTDWHLLWVEFHSDILKTNSLCTWISANRKHHLMSKANKIFISRSLVLQWFPFYGWPRNSRDLLKQSKATLKQVTSCPSRFPALTQLFCFQHFEFSLAPWQLQFHLFWLADVAWSLTFSRASSTWF